MPLPPFDTSSMDGYAVRAAELGGDPVPVVADIAAGDPPPVLAPGSVVSIATGAPIPAGADSVIPIEVVERDGDTIPRGGAQAGSLHPPRRRGCGPWRRGGLGGNRALARRTGCSRLGRCESYRGGAQAAGAAIATGSELVAAGRSLAPGQIYESNLTALTAQIVRAGGEVVLAEVVADDPQLIAAAFQRALAADVVISSGGVSVVPHDQSNPRCSAWARVRCSGGLPTSRASRSGSARPSRARSCSACRESGPSLVCFELFVRPALAVMQGAVTPPRLVARLSEPVERLADRDHAVRAALYSGPEGMLLGRSRRRSRI